ncbi:MAG: amidohydrolase [Lysobacterales bacterium]
MIHSKSIPISILALVCLLGASTSNADELAQEIKLEYDQRLGALFEHFHRNPELSYLEIKTAERLAEELRAAGFEVTEGVGGTGLVAIMENGTGPLVMMRADMDGLPLAEKNGLPYASVVFQEDQRGNKVPVMHACGHDVHMTSLVGTARIMSASKSGWSGTLMLIGQAAEERAGGAKSMKADRIWERFGQPDYALAFHVSAGDSIGKLGAVLGSPSSGSDSVELIIHGIGAHGASAHEGIDPIVLGSQIVMALQTVVSRDLPPREAGVITVGSFHAGTTHNIIPDKAHLQLTVRNDNFETRRILLEGIERVAKNMGRAAGLSEDLLPEVKIVSTSPPNMNDVMLTRRLRTLWANTFGDHVFADERRQGMFGEDFAFFTVDPYIPSTYFSVGGSSPTDVHANNAGQIKIAPHHSPLFKIEPEGSVRFGVEVSVLALRELLQE